MIQIETGPTKYEHPFYQRSFKGFTKYFTKTCHLHLNKNKKINV